MSGLPARTSQAQWADWLAAAPVLVGPTHFDAMILSRGMRLWLSGMPSPDLLQKAEAIQIGIDLLFLAEHLQEEVRAELGSGGLAFVIATVGSVSGAILPQFAVQIAFGTAFLTGVPLVASYGQFRRQAELKHTIAAIKRLANRLRQP